MKVLVACEYSGTVREAFKAKGHDAWSCDLLETEIPGNHIKGDVLDVVHNREWDLMIAHPPCTYLSYAATSSWNNPGRLDKRLMALAFFAELWEAQIPKICIENPKGCASPTIAKYSQEIQPYYFGDPEIKTTWLWLKGLPPLIHFEEEDLFQTKSHVEKPDPISIDSTTGKKRYFTDAHTRDPKERARFWPGIAKAMADQWTNNG